MRLRIVDLYCGAGGFSRGFEDTGRFQVVFGVEVNPTRARTFAANHRGAVALCDDIRRVPVREVADRLGGAASTVDVIVAGPPCQGFSSIRPYRSINENDRRNNLFEQLLVFIHFFQPRYVVFENVVGLLTHKDGGTFEAIRDSIEAQGYATAHRVLNAVHFGVPQRRERVILIARRAGRTSPCLPRPTHAYNGRSMANAVDAPRLPLFGSDLAPALTVWDAIGDLPPVTAGGAAISYCDDGVPGAYAAARRGTQTTLTLHAATHHTPRMLEIIRHAGSNRWALPEGLTSSGFSSSYSRLSVDEPSTTITVNFVHPASNRCIHPTQDRALTPREGARIQSFDDNFVFCGTRSEIARQIGEAVPPLLGRAIGECLVEQW
jgi:DNA (cytosine-5)-methyltransferase 1